jgi:hypothetical protein
VAVLDSGLPAGPRPAGVLLVVEQDWDAPDPLSGPGAAPAWGQAAARAGVLFSAWRDGSLAREPGAKRLT